MKPEYRSFPLEMQIEERDGKTKIIGHGAIYNVRSLDLGGFIEVVKPGAFKRSLESGKEIKSFFNHDPNMVLGTTTAGTLMLADESTGVRYEIDPPETTYAKDLMISMKRGDIKGSSFSFRTISDNWYMDGGQLMRELIEVELFELGPVTDPAYPASDSHVRNILNASGIEYDTLSQIFLRLKRGMPIEKVDTDLINNTIEALRSFIPFDIVPDVPIDEVPKRLPIQKRKLEIIEKLTKPPKGGIFM